MYSELELKNAESRQSFEAEESISKSNNVGKNARSAAKGGHKSVS